MALSPKNKPKPRDDFAGDASTKGKLAVGKTLTGNIEKAGDTDWIKVRLVKGRSYQFFAAGASTGNGSLKNPDIDIVDRNGKTVISGSRNLGPGGNEQVNRVNFSGKTGDYYIRVRSGAKGGTGTYQVNLRHSPVDEPDNRILKDQYQLYGNILSNGDSDSFKIAAKAGREYTIQVEGDNRNAASLGSADRIGVKLLDADGKPAKATVRNVGGKKLVTFKTAKDGAYTLRVSDGIGYRFGDYKVSMWSKPVSKPKPQRKDDFAGDASTKGKLAVGKTLTGNIEKAGDKDWVAVHLQAGQAYVITAKGASTGDGTLKDPKLRIMDASGQLVGTAVGDDRGKGKNDVVLFRVTRTFVAKKDGLHYLQVESGDKGATGSYKLKVAKFVPPVKPQPKDDFAGDASTKGKLSVGKTLTGNIEKAGDTDWIKVRLVKGRSYQFFAAGASTGNGSLKNPDIDIVDRNGKTVISGPRNMGPGGNEQVQGSVFSKKTGDYYIRVRSGAKGGTGSYQVNLRHSPVDEPDNRILKDQYNLYGNIVSNGDSDSFKIAAKAGREYTIQVEGDNRNAASLGSAERIGVKLLDANGKPAKATVRNVDGKKVVTFKTAKDGSYTLRVHDGIGYRFGDYKVSMWSKPVSKPKPQPKDDFAGDASTKGKLSVGKTLTGNIEKAGDTDWIKVRLVKGRSYQFFAAGASTGNGSLKNPDIDIVDRNGKTVISGPRNMGPGGNEQVDRVFLGKTGDYYIRVRSGAKGGTGTYQVNLRHSPVDEPDNRILKDQYNLFGNIVSNGDSDSFKIAAKAGREYTIQVEGDNRNAASLGSAERIGVKLLDADGKPAKATVRNVDGKKVVTFKTAKDGSYTLRVHDGIGYRFGDYKVSMWSKPAPKPKPQALRSVSQLLANAGAETDAPESQRGNKAIKHIAATGKKTAPDPVRLRTGAAVLRSCAMASHASSGGSARDPKRCLKPIASA